MARKPKEVSEGVKHARALSEAIEYYEAAYPQEWLAEMNYPFAGHLETVIARLNNK